MGRPLKIAKAQAVLTITDTNASGDYVTVSQDLSAPPAGLGIIAGMPFIPASNVGNLVGGTTYWILQVLSANTFTVSETALSANPTYTKFNLSGTTGQSVAATVGVVDAYFNNPVTAPGYPATNTTTYSVVGGNTAIYGKQTLVSVAIGRAGSGNVYSLTSSADVWGVNSDFANTAGLAAGSAIQIVNPATGALTNLGFVGSLYRFDANVTNTYSNGYVKCDNNTGFNSDKPVYLKGNIGGLVANKPYFVTSIDGGGQLVTLSTSPGGANVGLTAASGTVPVVAEALTLTTNATANSGAPMNSYFSNYIYANDEAGYIVRQKGKQKYLVTGTTTGLTGACYTANLANTALTPNTMSIIATYANAATVNVQSLSDHTAELFTATSGPVATGNIVLENASPAFSTFNAALAANSTQYGDFSYGNAQPYPIVTINNA